MLCLSFDSLVFEPLKTPLFLFELLFFHDKFDLLFVLHLAFDFKHFELTSAYFLLPQLKAALDEFTQVYRALLNFLKSLTQFTLLTQLLLQVLSLTL